MRSWVMLILFLAACGGDSGDGEPSGNNDKTTTLTDVKRAFGGQSSMCGLKGNGVLVCWGGDLYGTLGRGPTEEGIPGKPGYAAPVFGGLKFVEAALVQTACGVTTEGALFCWGPNDQGQLGDTSAETELISLGGYFDKPASKSPVEVFSSGVTHVGVGLSHVCASFENGDLKCWGQATYGAGGVIDGIENGAAPTDLDFDGKKVAQLELGVDASCLRSDDGEVYCWGTNLTGVLGVPDDRSNPDHLACVSNGSIQLRYCTVKPQLVPLPAPAKKLDVNGSCACAALDNEEVHCWGSSACGFGVDASGNLTPTKIDVAGPINDLAVTIESMCVLAQNKVWCAGYGYHGLTGSFENSADFLEVGGFEKTPIGLSAGQDVMCAILEDGSVACFGANDSWQAGVRAPADAVPGDLKSFSLTSPVVVQEQP